MQKSEQHSLYHSLTQYILALTLFIGILSISNAVQAVAKEHITLELVKPFVGWVFFLVLSFLACLSAENKLLSYKMRYQIFSKRFRYYSKRLLALYGLMFGMLFIMELAQRRNNFALSPIVSRDGFYELLQLSYFFSATLIFLIDLLKPLAQLIFGLNKEVVVSQD